MSKFLLSVALLGAALIASADGTLTYGDWKFNYTGETNDATITSVNTQGGSNLDMTSNTEGVTVTAIRSTVFDGCSNLANLTLPSTMTQFEADSHIFTGDFIGNIIDNNSKSVYLPVGDSSEIEKLEKEGKTAFEDNPDITINLTVTEGDILQDGGANCWGASIFCIGKNAFPTSLEGSVQLYWWGDRQPENIKGKFGIVYAWNQRTIATAVPVTAPFSVTMHIADHTVTVTATQGEGENAQPIPFMVNGVEQNEAKLSSYTVSGFNYFSYGMATGINATVKIDTNTPPRQMPHFANTGLTSITGNDYITSEGNGTLRYDDDKSLIYKPLNDVGSYFTIANQNNQYFYSNLRTDARGALDTGSDNGRRVFGAEMSTAIAPGSLFKVGHCLTDGGYKIAAVNSGSNTLEFGGKGGHDNLDVCVSTWSQAYVTTWLGDDKYILTNKQKKDEVYHFYPLSVNAGEAVKLTENNNVDIADETYHMTVKPATAIKLTFGDDVHYQATTLPVAVTIPQNVKAFEITGVTDKNEAMQKELTGTLPANTPFLAYCNDMEADFTIQAEAATAYEATNEKSLFKGTSTRVYGLQAGTFLTLDPASHAFVKTNATEVALGVPYILTSSITNPNYNGESLSLPAADPTSIHEVFSNAAADNDVYDLMGRKLSAPAKGINIINGRKIYVK